MSKVCPYQNCEYIGYDEIKVESCPIQEHITEELEICDYTNDYNECPIYVLQSQLQQRENIIKGAREYIHYRLDNGQDMYITQMAELLEILKCSDKVENDIEFDVLKALNTDLDDDVEMG